MNNRVCQICECDEVIQKDDKYICGVCGFEYSKEEYQKLKTPEVRKIFEEEKNNSGKGKIIASVLLAVAIIAGAFLFIPKSEEIVEAPVEETVNNLNDLEFVETLEKAIEKRAGLTMAEVGRNGLIEAEEKILFGFKDKEYSSEEFAGIVRDYFDALQQQKKQAYISEEELSIDDWNEGAKKRAAVVVYMMDNYGILEDYPEYQKMYRAYVDPEWWNLDADFEKQFFGESAKFVENGADGYYIITNNSNTTIDFTVYYTRENKGVVVQEEILEFKEFKPGESVEVHRPVFGGEYTDSYIDWVHTPS